jgi:tRNA uridine 5-carboxymethylaminomethyl modification enzyme
VKYSGYIEKRNNADKLTRLEDVKIPADFDYEIKSMSIEAKQKLSKIRPVTRF